MTNRLKIFRKKDDPKAFSIVKEDIIKNLYSKPIYYEYEVLSDTKHMILELMHTNLGNRDDYILCSHSKTESNHIRSHYFSDELTCDQETYMNLSKGKKIQYTVYTNLHYKSEDRFDEHAFYMYDDTLIMIELDRSADRHLFEKIYGKNFKHADCDLNRQLQDIWRNKYSDCSLDSNKEI